MSQRAATATASATTAAATAISGARTGRRTGCGPAASRDSTSRMAGRSAGSLARQSCTTERSGSGRSPSHGSAYLMRPVTAGTESSPNGGVPVAAEAMTHPHAKTSAAGPTSEPVSCSGAR